MITLSSDFGSPYPAAMKGVILQRCDARLVDIAHDFPRQDVRTAAFWLREILPTFPPAVHLVVVDPGVGTNRAAIVIRAGSHALVGPDNGVLVPAARRLAANDLTVYEIEVSDPDSATFHGRDVFAPAAADIYEADLEGLSRLPWLTPIDEYDALTFPEPELTEDRASGSVLVVDGFGNVITNIPGEVISELDRVAVRTADGDQTVPVVHSYAHVSPGDAVVTVGSHGNVECAVNQGRGDDTFGLGVDDSVTLSFKR